MYSDNTLYMVQWRASVPASRKHEIPNLSYLRANPPYPGISGIKSAPVTGIAVG